MLKNLQRQSTTGYAFTYAGGAIIVYRSKAQSLSALSPTEAEFIAAVTVGKTAQYICYLKWTFLEYENSTSFIFMFVTYLDVVCPPYAEYLIGCLLFTIVLANFFKTMDLVQPESNRACSALAFPSLSIASTQISVTNLSGAAPSQ